MSDTRHRDDRTDEELAREAAREGSNGPAFTALVGRFRDRVWRVCFRIMGNAEDASDAAQDVLVQMFMQRQRFEGRSKYSTWIHGIAVRTCLAMRRGRGRRQRRVSNAPALDLDATPSGDTAASAEMGMDLERMLAVLDEEDRALVVLKYTEEHTYEELSEVFGLSLSACKMRISRAVARLRERFHE